MEKISSTLNAIHEEIVKDIESQYNHCDKNIAIKNYLFRGENAENNKYQTGIYFEIESMKSSSNIYATVTYHIIEIADKKDQNSMIRMMNNMDTMSYTITQSGGSQLLARSSPRICIANYTPYGINIIDNEVKEIEVTYSDSTQTEG